MSFCSFSSCGGCFSQSFESMIGNYLKYQTVVERVDLFSGSESVVDVSFIEGSIATLGDEEKLKKIRSNSKKVFLVGGCSISGWPSIQKNHFDQLSEYEKVISKNQFFRIKTPVEIISVDGKLQGCPVTVEQFNVLIDRLLVEFGVMSRVDS